MAYDSHRSLFCLVSIGAILFSDVASTAHAAEVRLHRKKHDPYGSPRPARGQQNVPLSTSFYIELAIGGNAPLDEVLPESVSIALKPEGGGAFEILKSGIQFAPRYTGRLFPGKSRRGRRMLVVYVDSQRKLKPCTTYTIRLRARSRNGAELPAKAGTWRFTTETEPQTHKLDFQLSFDSPPVKWNGAFFSGFCKPSFCTSHANRIASYELMDRVRKSSPKAWSLQRDFTLTGMETGPTLLSPKWPNIVRERETRRITAVESQKEGNILHVEDFFGHEQYGIGSGRPLSEDYHPGDEVLIADGKHDARAKVVAVDDQMKTVRVTGFDTPQGDWKLAYSAALPTKEDPNAPGLFPPGGCYLRKFRPSGTPVYYWGRLDREWDLAQRRFQRRPMPNFTDAPGDLSIDGRSWTTAKDYAQLHEVVRTIAGHIIDRYGDAALDFPWSVFNEPDLIGYFWRSDWNELQKFYDYTVDAILRAFEDRGYDADRVAVGGLELGAIFGTHLRLRDFLVHCSPLAEAKGALTLNAAFADPRLDGKRSKRVETLCRKHKGRGSPCDFVSIHAYNTSKLMAGKLIRAKQMALDIDSESYADLWINSHESAPGWNMPPDPAFGDSYLGNGYFPTWCADVARRQLQQAAQDRRYAFGETILTFWPWPNMNFGGGNACTRVIQVDDDGDGKTDRTAAVAMPILHFLGLTASMGGDYWVLPERTVGAHVVSGFASQSKSDVRVLLYSHHPLDTESRSQQAFEVALDLTGLKGRHVEVKQYRFDKDHNSYYRLGRSLREARIAASQNVTAETKGKMRTAMRSLRSDEKETVLAALRELADLGARAKSAAVFLFPLIQNTEDAELRAQATATVHRMMAPQPYPAEIVRRVEDLAALRATESSTQTVNADGRLRINVSLAANGADFVVIADRP